MTRTGYPPACDETMRLREMSARHLQSELDVACGFIGQPGLAPAAIAGIEVKIAGLEWEIERWR
jgi:hypothetical protein